MGHATCHMAMARHEAVTGVFTVGVSAFIVAAIAPRLVARDDDDEQSAPGFPITCGELLRVFVPVFVARAGVQKATQAVREAAWSSFLRIILVEMPGVLAGTIAAALLLGAPITRLWHATFAWCACVAALIVSTAPPASIQTTFPIVRLADPRMMPSMGAVVGAWAGAVVIPLDWGESYQTYPKSLILGALAGHAAGSARMLFMLATQRAIL